MEWHMGHKIRVDASAWIFFSLMILLLPLKWVWAAIFAAAVHECFHLAALACLRIPVYSLNIGGRGAVLETGGMRPGQELLCALVGPVGSFLLVLMLHRFPRLALCGLAQGTFNLIPTTSSDGWRAVRSLIALLPGKSPCKQGKEGVQ